MFKNNQFNRLELLLLSLLYQKDLECFEICKLINIQSKESFHPKNAILFTTLYHFENSRLLSSYESEGLLYYHLEEAGRVRLDMLKREYQHIVSGINYILDYSSTKR